MENKKNFTGIYFGIIVILLLIIIGLLASVIVITMTKNISAINSTEKTEKVETVEQTQNETNITNTNQIENETATLIIKPVASPKAENKIKELKDDGYYEYFGVFHGLHLSDNSNYKYSFSGYWASEDRSGWNEKKYYVDSSGRIYLNDEYVGYHYLMSVGDEYHTTIITEEGYTFDPVTGKIDSESKIVEVLYKNDDGITRVVYVCEDGKFIEDSLD